MKLAVIILAAGQGKRMYSDLPKVLHTLADKPLLQHVIETALGLQPDDIYVIYGHGGAQVQQRFADFKLHWVEQKQQLGTGHAVAQAMPYLQDDTLVLVLAGDVPLIQAASLQILCRADNEPALRLLTVHVDEPKGYGRIVRNAANQVVQIVEERDADPNIRQIKEINTGILAAPAYYLRDWLENLHCSNAVGEYYLTDIIAMAARSGINIFTYQPNSHYEVLGVNNRVQLSELERYYQKQQATHLMENGVSLKDPARLDIRGTVKAGFDVNIDVNVILEGKVILGNRVNIAANVIIKNSIIGDDCNILANSILEDCQLADNCRVGPFARLRPGSQLADNVHIGNFVEIKQSRIDKSTKINHLSYIGDAEIGQEVNIGAGSITCNYDGANKWPTIIGNRVFIGSDSQLVAPVKIGNDATIAAGSTITQDVAAQELAIARTRQLTKNNWQRPVKKSPDE